MFIVSDLESIGDIIDKNLVPLALKMLRSESAHFSEEGRQELESLHLAVSERLSQAIIALTVKETSLAKSVIAGFQALQKEGKLLHYNHLARLRRNVLESVETSSVHLDVINYLLRIDYLVFDICLHIEGKGLPEELYASKA
jgi:phosphate:Na+ symporter